MKVICVRWEQLSKIIQSTFESNFNNITQIYSVYICSAQWDLCCCQIKLSTNAIQIQVLPTMS